MTTSSLRLNLMLIDRDPEVRQRFRDRVVEPADWQVVLEADSAWMAKRVLRQWFNPLPAESTEQIGLDLVILNLELPTDAIVLCQDLHRQYPTLPILTTSQVAIPSLVTSAFQAGAMGYCQQDTAFDEWLQAMQQVANGYSAWTQGMASMTQIALNSANFVAPPRSTRAWDRWRSQIQQSGLAQIERAIAEINAQLRDPDLSLLDQLVLTGRRRELYASRWLVSHLFTTTSERREDRTRTLPNSGRSPISAPPPVPPSPGSVPPSAEESPSSLIVRPESAALRSIQAALFDTTVAKIQLNLRNLTDTPLELDILREDRKRELLLSVLRQLEHRLAELRFSQIDLAQLRHKEATILDDLWQATMLDFFGRYTTLPLDDSPVDRLTQPPIEITEVLLQDGAIVEAEILSKIPMVADFFAHLLLQLPLMVNETSYAIGTVEAMNRMEALLQNLMIQVGNAVVQPLLNRFGNVVAVKQQFYDRRLLSTREIERFRNDLSWKYRVHRYFKEPTAIFESRYNLFVLSELGIVKTSIYSPRSQELDELAGVGLAVTIALEARDAIAPRLRSAISFVGSGVVYVLTEVIGRGIGLIGRGIIKGVGNVMQDPKFSRNSARGKE